MKEETEVPLRVIRQGSQLHFGTSGVIHHLEITKEQYLTTMREDEPMKKWINTEQLLDLIVKLKIDLGLNLMTLVVDSIAPDVLKGHADKNVIIRELNRGRIRLKRAGLKLIKS